MPEELLTFRNLYDSPMVGVRDYVAELGVARISYGPGPYRQMIESLTDAGRAAFL